MYAIYAYIWGVNVGIYGIHGVFGIFTYIDPFCNHPN